MAIYITCALPSTTSSYSDLLRHIEFDALQDSLWLTGNLFDGLEADDVFENFTFLSSLKKSLVAVLGKTEINLLSYADGFIPAELSEDENAQYEVITSHAKAPDMLSWLRNLPIMHRDKKINMIMVHAGLPPEWSLSQVSTFAIEIETALSFGNHKALFENIQCKPQRRWNAKLQGWKRLQFILTAFTQIKKCNEKGYMDFVKLDSIKSPANTDDFLSWYQFPRTGTNVVFDHRGWDVAQHEANILPIEENQVLKITDSVEVIQL